MHRLHFLFELHKDLIVDPDFVLGVFAPFVDGLRLPFAARDLIGVGLHLLTESGIVLRQEHFDFFEFVDLERLLL